MKRFIWLLIITAFVTGPAMAAIQDIRVSNNTSASVTISWITDEETGGQVRYGAQSDLSDALVAHDTRGESFAGCTHYVVAEKLQPETMYYFEVISGGQVDNNRGSYYSCETMKAPSAPPGTCLYYGYVYHGDGITPAEGALVYARLKHAGIDSYLLSRLVGHEGSFLFTLREARSTATDDLFSYTKGDPLRLEAVHCEDSTGLDLVFAGCPSRPPHCGTLLLGVSSSSSTSVGSTSTTSSPVGPTTTTTVVISSSSSTTPSTVTTTSIPASVCEVIIDPLTLTLRPFKTFQFTAKTICNGYAVGGRYRWSIDSAKGSSIGGEGMFRAGAVAETVAVTAVDIDHEEIAGTATVTVAALWPRVYEELWGEVRAENLAVMRTFRDTVMADREWGRNAITLLYDNSAELAVLLLYHPLLRREARDAAGMMIPDIKLLLAGKPVTITRSKKARLLSCIDAFAREAFSPQLQSGLGQIRADVTSGAAFKQFGIAVGNKK